MDALTKITPLLKCIECNHEELHRIESSFICPVCKKKYPIKNGIPRFVPESFIAYDTQQTSLEEKTKNYFGFEWEVFDNWGFIDESKIDKKKLFRVYGGTNSARKKTFDLKCRLSDDELAEQTVVLDGGCGNGRYTYVSRRLRIPK